MLDPVSLQAQRRQAVRTVIAVLSAVALAPLSSGSGPSALEGDLRIVGSRAMTPTVDDWMALFQRRYPAVRIHAALIGDGVAAGALADRRADIAPLSRPLARQERALIGDVPQPVGIPVGTGRSSGGQLRRWVYLYVARQADGRGQPVALAFVRTALSPAGQARIARGFGALSARQREASLSQLARLGRNAAEPK